MDTTDSKNHTYIDAGGDGVDQRIEPTLQVGGIETLARTIPVRFTGRASEYFRIWAVNLALTLLTLGVYSAWAKVRKNRYLYAHTWFDDANFEYRAKPGRILFGRILAVVVFGALWFFSKSLLAMAGLFMYGVTIFLLGLIVVLAMRFRMRNTAWRNMRFRFDGGKGEGFLLYTIGTLLSLFSGGLLYPLFVQRRKAFIVNHTLFANRRFRFAGRSGSVYGIYGLALLIIIAFVVLVTVVSILLQGSSGWIEKITEGMLTDNPTASASMMVFVMTGVIIAIYFGIYFAWVFIKAAVTRYVWKNTLYGDTRFESRMTARKLFWIYATNALLLPLSLGLLYPWTMIRLARYRVECISATTTEDVDELMSHAQDPASAVGEEFGDMFDVGLA